MFKGSKTISYQSTYTNQNTANLGLGVKSMILSHTQIISVYAQHSFEYKTDYRKKIMAQHPVI